MSFLVLCPRCRHQVSVQESMAGQPARCPYCKLPFQVPSPPRPAPSPAPRSSALPPRGAVSPGKPAAATRSTKTPPRPPQTRTPALRDISPEPRSPRTLYLGLMSAGIVVILLAGLIGTAAYLSRDQIPSRVVPPETQFARAKSQPTTKPVPHPPTKETATKPFVQPEKQAQKKSDDVEKAKPIEPPVPKQQTEKSSPSTLVEEEPKPSRSEATKHEAPPEEVRPKPAPPVKEEPPKRDEPAKAETPPPAPTEEEPRPPVKSTAKTETVKDEGSAAPLPERRRLSGDELYRRLIKSCVYVRNIKGWGSGSLIHKNRKLILTNYHVVGDSAEVYVSFPRYKGDKLIVEGDFYELAYKRKELIRGKILKIAKGQDLALVELDTIPDGTPALKLAARSASPGQGVHSVGNPGASDARWLYTSGTVRQLSHKTWRARGGGGKILSFDADILETQSPTNAGDSGGPLVNDALQLVGVTQGGSSTANALSFFIDVSEVKKLLQAYGVDLSEVTASSDVAEGGMVDTSDILALIKGLEHKDGKVRTEAARRLAELGPQAQRAAAALLKALKDEEPLVRQSAAVALGKLGPGARDAARKGVFKALRDADAEVRLAALEALTNLGAPDLTELPILLSMLRGCIERQEYKFCLPIARSLALLGPRAKDAVPDLRDMLKSEDRSVRAAALLALRKIGSAARDAAPQLSEALKDSDREVRMQAAMALAAIDPSLAGAGKNALSVLVQSLRPASKGDSDDVQTKARIKEISAVLVKIGEPVVERLLSAIAGEFHRGRSRTEAGDLDAQARVAAVKIIAEIGPAARSTTTIKALADLRRSDPYRSVKDAAREAYIAVQEK